MSNENMELPEKILSKEEAIAEIGVYMQEANLMGGNDTEIPALMDLTKRVKSGEYKDLNKAVEEAKAIRYSKQDYH